jgi:hypothetical protein
MENYLDIPLDKVRLGIQTQVVHLSQPKFAMLYDKQILAWKRILISHISVQY